MQERGGEAYHRFYIVGSANYEQTAVCTTKPLDLSLYVIARKWKVGVDLLNEKAALRLKIVWVDSILRSISSQSIRDGSIELWI